LIPIYSFLFSAFGIVTKGDFSAETYLMLRLLRIGLPSDGVDIFLCGVSCLGGYTASLKSAFTSEVCYCTRMGTLTLLFGLVNDERRCIMGCNGAPALTTLLFDYLLPPIR
jgi:hypothetical protein